MAKKTASSKKKVPAPRSIEIKVDLGPVTTATPEQRARLRAYVENHLMTWVTKDLKNKTAPPINCFDIPNAPFDGGDGNGGNG
jgi:hypothetical protein